MCVLFGPYLSLNQKLKKDEAPSSIFSSSLAHSPFFARVYATFQPLVFASAQPGLSLIPRLAA